MSVFRINISVPLASESYMQQSEQLIKLKAPLDVFRKALAAIAPEHEYHDEIVKPRATSGTGARRGRKPKVVETDPQVGHAHDQAAE
jgi:hypothetical protein